MSYQLPIKSLVFQNSVLFFLSSSVFGVSIYYSFSGKGFIIPITVFFIGLLIAIAIIEYGDLERNEKTRKWFVTGCVFLLSTDFIVRYFSAMLFSLNTC